ncbi:MAG: hypothetical protein ACQEW8_07220 [Actinomycetota bacterium]
MATDTGWFGSDRTVWSASGEEVLLPGEEFVLFREESLALEVERSTEMPLEDASLVSVSITGDPGGFSVYELSELSSDAWLRWDGEVSVTPCGAVRR